MHALEAAGYAGDTTDAGTVLCSTVRGKVTCLLLQRLVWGGPGASQRPFKFKHKETWVS